MVGDGHTQRHVYDWAKFEDRETVFVRTRRGFELEGSVTHRVMLPDGQWRRLDEVQVADRVLLGAGPNVWAQEYVALNWQPQREVTLDIFADRTDGDIEPIIRYRHNLRERQSEVFALPVGGYDTDVAILEPAQSRARFATIPSVVDEKLATLLGYISSDQHHSEIKSTLGLATGDAQQADHFATLVQSLFGVQ